MVAQRDEGAVAAEGRQVRLVDPDGALLQRPRRLVVAAELDGARAGAARPRQHVDVAAALARPRARHDLVARFPFGRQQAVRAADRQA